MTLHKSYGENALSNLHQSLNIEDKVAALIRKQKLLLYPDGTSFAGEYLQSICPTYTDNISIGVQHEYLFDCLQDSNEQ